MTSAVHHTLHHTLLRLTSQNHHLYFPGSTRSHATVRNGTMTQLRQEDLRALTLSDAAVTVFSMAFVGDRETIVRTQSSAHETNKHPAPKPERTMVQHTLSGRLETSPGSPLLRTQNRIPPHDSRHDPPPKRNHCSAPCPKATKPAALYPVVSPLLLQTRAS